MRNAGFVRHGQAFGHFDEQGGDVLRAAGLLIAPIAESAAIDELGDDVVAAAHAPTSCTVRMCGWFKAEAIWASR